MHQPLENFLNLFLIHTIFIDVLGIYSLKHVFFATLIFYNISIMFIYSLALLLLLLTFYLVCMIYTVGSLRIVCSWVNILNDNINFYLESPLGKNNSLQLLRAFWNARIVCTEVFNPFIIVKVISTTDMISRVSHSIKK